MPAKTMHIGLDDTDSTKKGCTTYVAALLVERLEKLGASFIDYPNLIRLNPNVPWKTRGNGALCLRIRCSEGVEDETKETVVSTVEENSDLESRGTDPGVVFLATERIPREIRAFAEQTITGVVTANEARRLLTRFRGEAVGFKNARGIVGGLAAIGGTLQADHTYEVLAYRTPENCGLKRRVDEASIFSMDRATAPYTFNNVDAEKRRVIITPRGPDPVLFGVRGETPEAVKRAFEMVRTLEPIERWVVFRTNQGTDAHLRRIGDLSRLEPHSSVIAEGTVRGKPRMIKGRHVIFPVGDKYAHVECAAYEPTGVLNRVARELSIGDTIEVYGSVRDASVGRPLTLNLEKIRVVKLAPKIVYQNPKCPRCGKRLESMGKGKGFRCRRCRLRDTSLGKVEVRLNREIRKGLYATSTRSQRHLTKPLSRYGMEKRRRTDARLIGCWHFP